MLAPQELVSIAREQRSCTGESEPIEALDIRRNAVVPHRQDRHAVRDQHPIVL